MLKISLQKNLTFKLYYKLTTGTSEESKPAKNENKFQFIFINGTYGSRKNKFAENLAGYQLSFGTKIHIFSKRYHELPGLNAKKFVGDMLRQETKRLFPQKTGRL